MAQELFDSALPWELWRHIVPFLTESSIPVNLDSMFETQAANLVRASSAPHGQSTTA